MSNETGTELIQRLTRINKRAYSPLLGDPHHHLPDREDKFPALYDNLLRWIQIVEVRLDAIERTLKDFK